MLEEQDGDVLREGIRVLLEEAAGDVLAYRHCPVEHHRQLHSTNPLERLNKEIKRRNVRYVSRRRAEDARLRLSRYRALH